MAEDVRKVIGSQLAAMYETDMAPLPPTLVSLLAHLAVAKAVAEFDSRAG